MKADLGARVSRFSDGVECPLPARSTPASSRSEEGFPPPAGHMPAQLDEVCEIARSALQEELPGLPEAALPQVLATSRRSLCRAWRTGPGGGDGRIRNRLA